MNTFSIILGSIVSLISVSGLTFLITAKYVRRQARAGANKADVEVQDAKLDLLKETEEFYSQKLEKVEAHWSKRLEKAYETIGKQDDIISEYRKFKEDVLKTVDELKILTNTFEKFFTKAYNCDHHSKDNPCPILSAYLGSKSTQIPKQ